MASACVCVDSPQEWRVCAWARSLTDRTESRVSEVGLIFIAVFFLMATGQINRLKHGDCQSSLHKHSGRIVFGWQWLQVSCLLCFHTFLMLANLTTWEHISWLQITYLSLASAELFW